MIYEMATLVVAPDRSGAFEAAVASCAALFRDANGCHSMTLEAVIEHPGRYVLRVGWDSIEDHMIGFRGTPEFQEWRAVAGPFFIETPIVVHHAVTQHCPFS